MEEAYVSFETAKLLKEKEFDEKCQKVYMHNGQLLWAQIFMEGESFVDNKCIEAVANYNDWITHTQGEYAYLCPTLQMAMKWLREVHNIHIGINPISGKGYNATIYDVADFDDYGIISDTESFFHVEQACEVAIKYCLEKLI